MERRDSTYERERELALAAAIEERSIALWSALLASPATAAVVARLTDERRPEQLHALDVDHVLADRAVALVASSRDPEVVAHAGVVAAAARAVAEARNRLVEDNLGLVGSIANRFRSAVLSREDLMQEGTLGLIKAVGRFDHRRGFRFSTFATWWIRNRMRRALLAAAGIVRDLHLDAPVGEDGQEYLDVFVDPNAEPVDTGDTLDYHTLAAAARDLVASLTAMEQEVLHRRFGFAGDDERAQSLREIASAKGLSHERIRQIEAKALRKLRARLVPMVAEPHAA
jgi:RNA polymerase sigma factor (sigma-70 family)